MRRGSALAVRAPSALGYGAVRCGATSLSLPSPRFLFSHHTRDYTTKDNKPDGKQKMKEKRIKKLLKSGEPEDYEYITPERLQNYKYNKGLTDFTLKKQEMDSPHVKEFVYTASGEQLSYETLARKVEAVANSFMVDRGRMALLAELLQEVRDREFELTTREAELVRENPKLSKEEKEWFGQFNEFSGELDESFISSVHSKLLSILRDVPEAEQTKEEATERKRDRNEGRILFNFSANKQVYVGGTFELTDEEIATYLPEGVAGLLPKLNFGLMGDKGVILRKRTYSIIDELAKRREKHFLGGDAKKSIIIDGPAGSGKSTALTQIVLWARENGWLVVWVPDGEEFVGGMRITPSKIDPGYFDQRFKCVHMANMLIQAHKDKLKAIKTRGEFTVRQFNSKGTTLYDLLEYGASELKAAADCMYWFRRELSKVTEFPVLIAVDGYNHLYHLSDYWNPEDSARYRPRTLPSQKLSLTHWFSNHEDPGLANGMMVCALKTSAEVKSYYAQCGKKYCVTLPNYSPEEFEEVVTHYTEKEWMMEVPKFTASYIYHLSDMNPREIFRYCGTM